MGSLLQRQKNTEFKKRVLFLVSSVSGIALFVIGNSFMGASLFATGIYFGWKWFKYRAQNGMRF